MSNEAEYKDKCEAILNWAYKANKTKYRMRPGKRFDTSFIESVQSFIENEDFVSDSQMTSINNIIEKYRIKIA